jgi:hypothetical protein
MITIILNPSDDLFQQLQRQSNMLQTSKDSIARDALQRYLARTRFRTLRSKLVPRAVNQGIHTDEDVFHKIAHPHDGASTSGSASL